MIYAKIKTSDGITESRIFFNMREIKSFGLAVLYVLPLEVHGKTHRECKEYLRKLATEYLANNDDDTDIPLTSHEVDMIDWWFYMNALSYGLVNEFRLQGII